MSALTDPSSRLKYWLLSLFFAVVVMISIALIDTNPVTNPNEPSPTAKGWALAVIILTFIATAAVVAFHFHPLGSIVIGTKYEILITFVTAIFWLIIVCLATGPIGGLAMDSEGAVGSGNLYYFSWAALFLSAVTAARLAKSTHGVDVGRSMTRHSKSFIYWALLLVSSLVVMSVSSNYYNNRCDDGEDQPEPQCFRTVLAISAGALGTVFSLIVVAMKMSYGSISFLVEVSLCAFLFVMWTLEVGYVTDTNGPGAALSNLYYFSWISFLVTFSVGKACYDDMMSVEETHSVTEDDPPMPGIPRVGSEDVEEVRPPSSYPPSAPRPIEPEEVSTPSSDPPSAPRPIEPEEVRTPSSDPLSAPRPIDPEEDI